MKRSHFTYISHRIGHYGAIISTLGTIIFNWRLFVHNSVIYIWSGFQNNSLKDTLLLKIFCLNLSKNILWPRVYFASRSNTKLKKTYKNKSALIFEGWIIDYFHTERAHQYPKTKSFWLIHVFRWDTSLSPP